MKVKTPAYARMLGCTTRSIVRLIERGLPATKKGGPWEVDVAQADRWVQSNARRIWNRTNRVAAGESPRSKGSSGRRPGRRRRRASKPAPAADRNGDLEPEDERLRRLDAVLAKFIEQLEGDEVNLDARAVNGVKQISTELRMLDRHRREMLEADRRLMPPAEIASVFSRAPRNGCWTTGLTSGIIGINRVGRQRTARKRVRLAPATGTSRRPGLVHPGRSRCRRANNQPAQRPAAGRQAAA